MSKKTFREQLLSLPYIGRLTKGKVYNELWIVPTGKKHDSGWGCMAIIGVVNKKPIEIINECCDDLCLDLPEKKELGLRMDCDYPSRLTHYWSWYYDFELKCNLSSTEFKLVKKDK